MSGISGVGPSGNIPPSQPPEEEDIQSAQTALQFMQGQFLAQVAAIAKESTLMENK